MSVGLYMDVHVPGPITQQLRRRGIDVVTAQEDLNDSVPDERVLARRDNTWANRFYARRYCLRVLAEEWQTSTGREFSGLL